MTNLILIVTDVPLTCATSNPTRWYNRNAGLSCDTLNEIPEYRGLASSIKRSSKLAPTPFPRYSGATAIVNSGV